MSSGARSQDALELRNGVPVVPAREKPSTPREERGLWLFLRKERYQRLSGRGQIEDRECGDPSSPTPLLAGLNTDLTRGISEPGRVEDGSLLLTGEVDGQVTWYGVAIRRGGDGPYELGGHAYDRGEVLHFSSGLWLIKADSFTIEPAWIENGVLYLPKGVGLRLNEEGEVLRAVIPTRH